MTDELAISSGEGSFVVSPHGGRVSRLFVAGHNLFWEGESMPFPPGDRLWPAPEVEVFYDEHGTWRCPPELDPGDWTLNEDFALEQKALDASFRREIRAVPIEGWTIPCVAYSTLDTIDSPHGWLPWHLIQVPAPARVFVLASDDPVVYYPPAPEVDDGWMDATGTTHRWKLGWPAPADGRVIVAALSVEDPGGMVVITSSAAENGTYVDIPPDGGEATAVQVFDAGGEGFCELEHHAWRERPELASTVIGAYGSTADRLAHLTRLSR